jgi:hypothetical protein
MQKSSDRRKLGSLSGVSVAAEGVILVGIGPENVDRPFMDGQRPARREVV